jgi:Na+-transporting NADH:ubiquinone oxidoreductase subunit NqrF
MDFFTPLIIIGVLLVITIVLLALDQLIGSNEDKTLTINDDKTIAVTETDTLLNTLAKENIYLPSACGGKATCGTCKVTITEGAPDVSPVEAPLLSKQEQENNVRLSCQTKVRTSMKIEVLRELLDAKEYRGKIEAIEDLTYDIKLVRIRLIDPETMDFKPGQYAQIAFPASKSNEPTRSRPIPRTATTSSSLSASLKAEPPRPSSTKRSNKTTTSSSPVPTATSTCRKTPRNRSSASPVGAERLRFVRFSPS